MCLPSPVKQPQTEYPDCPTERQETTVHARASQAATAAQCRQQHAVAAQQATLPCADMQGSGAHHNQARCTSDDLASVEREGREGAPLGYVGLVVWQSAFVLADYLVARPPYGTWQGVSVIDLGTGTGGRPRILSQLSSLCSKHLPPLCVRACSHAASQGPQ